MTKSQYISLAILLLGPFQSGGLIYAVDAKPNNSGAISYSRQVTFELTFANGDLIWLGDPASPAALVYPRPGARPIATDLCVSTLIENDASPRRRYFEEARIATENDVLNVYAYTSDREKHIGAIDAQGSFSPNATFHNNSDLLPSWPTDSSILAYDPQKNLLYHDVEVPGPLVSESSDYLPWRLVDAHDKRVEGRFSVDFAPSDDGADSSGSAAISLTLDDENHSITLASATLPQVFRRAEVQMGSFNNDSGAYFTEAAYRAGATSNQATEPSVTIAIPGKFSSSIRSDGASLVLLDAPPSQKRAKPSVSRDRIAIDGNFDDWRNVSGVQDVRGDVVPYLEYIPDVDLLEFKVAHDNENIYLYARVAGKVGRSHPNGGRSYFYAYMDVDRDPNTGFLPTRDDDCYFGVDIGDDCEVQFEFVGNTLRKTFYGFCGIGGNENVLKQQVSLGKSQYGRFDANGNERANYKSEYIFRGGVTEITEDLKLGTSDTIHVAVSPDGNEVEVSSALTGFLKNPKGQPTVQLGQTIDLAVGMECDSKAYPGKTRWAADSTPVIYGYKLVPSAHFDASREANRK